MTWTYPGCSSRAGLSWWGGPEEKQRRRKFALSLAHLQSPPDYYLTNKRSVPGGGPPTLYPWGRPCSLVAVQPDGMALWRVWLVVEGIQYASSPQHVNALPFLLPAACLPSPSPHLSSLPPKSLKGQNEAQPCLCHLSWGETVTADGASVLTGAHSQTHSDTHTQAHSPRACTATLSQTKR